MTREETQKLIAEIMAIYPGFNPHDMTATINAWTKVLEEYSFSLMEGALMMFVRSGESVGFPPGPANLINQINKINDFTELTEQQAWNMVRKALENSNYNSEKEFSKLPQIVQDALGNHEVLRAWASTNVDEVDTVVASNFQRNYRTVAQRSRQAARMPEEYIALVQNTTKMLEG